MWQLFHSKTVQALGSWLGILSAFFALLSKLSPGWFGQLTWPEAILSGIALALVVTLVGAVALFIASYGFRLIKPLPVPEIPTDRPTPQQRLETRLKIIQACRGSIIGYRQQAGYFTDYVEGGASFMAIRRHLDRAFLEAFEELRHSLADQSVHGELPTLAKRFLEEVDKVADRWGIDD
jgi:hypothetical protein